MKTEREVEMLNLRPYGDWDPISLSKIMPHLREEIIKITPAQRRGFDHEVLEDVLGNLYCFVWNGGIVLTKLDDGAATIIDEIEK